jgi:glycosidase
MPTWLAESVIYEINTPVFSAAGNFAGVTARLDDLRALGVNLLWLMPVHPVGRVNAKPPFGSLYAVRDYYGIDPGLGTSADLHHLIGEAHRRGMRVIIDIVANHTAWDSVLMEHPDFYKHDAQGRIAAPNPDWLDVAALDYGNPKVRTYMTAMLEHWVREFDLDGFRCDVAGLVPVDFWEAARERLEQIKPDIVMLAEWDDPALLRRAFDIDYSWPLYKTLKPVMAGTSPASEIRKTWEEQKARYRPGALHMRFSDNHDEQRAIALFGLEGAMAAAVLMFGLDGVPLVYNGMEVGDSTESGGDAMFSRLKIFWPIEARRPQFLPFFKKLIAVRRGSKTLQHGNLEWMDHSESERAVLFRRRGPEEMLVAVNLSNRPVRLRWEGGLRASEYRPVFGEAMLGDNALDLQAWGFGMWTGGRA